MFTTSEATVRELDHRASDGIDVRLLWNSRTDTIAVAVNDGRSGDSFELEVDAADALDAFRHPFAYPSSIVAPASRLGSADEHRAHPRGLA